MKISEFIIGEMIAAHVTCYPREMFGFSSAVKRTSIMGMDIIENPNMPEGFAVLATDKQIAIWNQETGSISVADVP